MISSKLPRDIEIEKPLQEMNSCEGELKYIERRKIQSSLSSC